MKKSRSKTILFEIGIAIAIGIGLSTPLDFDFDFDPDFDSNAMNTDNAGSIQKQKLSRPVCARCETAQKF